MNAQEKAMRELAQNVRSNYKRLDESQIVGRVMLITGRTFQQSLKGMKMLKAGKYIDGLIEPKSEGVLEDLISRNPALLELIERFDCIPQGMRYCDPKPYSPPAKIDPKDVARALNLGTF